MTIASSSSLTFAPPSSPIREKHIVNYPPTTYHQKTPLVCDSARSSPLTVHSAALCSSMAVPRDAHFGSDQRDGDSMEHTKKQAHVQAEATRWSHSMPECATTSGIDSNNSLNLQTSGSEILISEKQRSGITDRDLSGDKDTQACDLSTAHSRSVESHSLRTDEWSSSSTSGPLPTHGAPKTLSPETVDRPFISASSEGGDDLGAAPTNALSAPGSQGSYRLLRSAPSNSPCLAGSPRPLSSMSSTMVSEAMSSVSKVTKNHHLLDQGDADESYEKSSSSFTKDAFSPELRKAPCTNNLLRPAHHTQLFPPSHDIQPPTPLTSPTLMGQRAAPAPGARLVSRTGMDGEDEGQRASSRAGEGQDGQDYHEIQREPRPSKEQPVRRSIVSVYQGSPVYGGPPVYGGIPAEKSTPERARARSGGFTPAKSSKRGTTTPRRTCHCERLLAELNQRSDEVEALTSRSSRILEKDMHLEAENKDMKRRLKQLEHKIAMYEQTSSMAMRDRGFESTKKTNDWMRKALEVLLLNEDRLPSVSRWLIEAKKDTESGDQFVSQLEEWISSGALQVHWGGNNAPRSSEAASEIGCLQNEVRLLRDQLQEQGGTIRVFCRLKPNPNPCVKVANPMKSTVEITSPQVCGNRPTAFTFDKILDAKSTQEDVYAEIQDVVGNLAFSGFYCVIMAYGQTGSGKTYTLDGDEQNPGIQRAAIRQILQNCSENPNITFELSVLEMYNDTVRDLQSPHLSSNLEVRQNPPNGADRLFGDMYVPNLTYKSVKTWEDVLQQLEFIKQLRRSGATALNETSSRSHTIVSLSIHRNNGFSAIHFIDLAGSERTKHSQSEGVRMVEANCINRSLSALGDTLLAMEQKKAHIPYRNSKLSFLLSDMLSKRWSKVLMLATCSSDEVNAHETFSTLSFANRVQRIRRR